MKISFPDDLRKITFVDLEASSLHGGWPIELGFAHLYDDGTILSGAWLIYPDQDWVEDWDYWTGWSLESEAVHGISKGLLLDQGIATQRVVEHFEAEIAETLLVSDAPAYDQGWIRQLYQAAGVANKPVLHSIQIIAANIAGVAESWQDILSNRNSMEPDHRAEADALWWAKAFLEKSL